MKPCTYWRKPLPFSFQLSSRFSKITGAYADRSARPLFLFKIQFHERSIDLEDKEQFIRLRYIPTDAVPLLRS